LLIVKALAEYDPDVIILIEYRTKSSAAIQKDLFGKGWVHIDSTRPERSDNGICVLSRIPFDRHGASLAPAENAIRWLDINFPSQGLGLGILYVPGSTSGSRSLPRGHVKRRFWDAVLSAAEARINQPFMFVGDFNTGLHWVDEREKTFFSADQFERLSTTGWVDSWRYFHGERLEPTWYSVLKGGVRGNPFRIDHAFVSPVLLPRLRDCRYSHSEREENISDHSILLVELANQEVS